MLLLPEAIRPKEKEKESARRKKELPAGKRAVPEEKDCVEPANLLASGAQTASPNSIQHTL